MMTYKHPATCYFSMLSPKTGFYVISTAFGNSACENPSIRSEKEVRNENCSKVKGEKGIFMAMLPSCYWVPRRCFHLKMYSFSAK